MSKNKKPVKGKNSKPLSPFELVYSPIFQIGFVFVFLTSFYFSYNAFATNYFSISGENERITARKIEVLNNVSKMTALPNEIPFVLEVDNPNVLIAKDAFYANVKSGDYVLYFYEANRIVIYRMSENRIINMGPYLGGF